MKNIIILACALCFTTFIWAQQKPTDLDKSPMDMSYWPANYPILKLNGKAKSMASFRDQYLPM